MSASSLRLATLVPARETTDGTSWDIAAGVVTLALQVGLDGPLGGSSVTAHHLVLKVIRRSNGGELLRFDVGPSEPRYHYVRDGGSRVSVAYDEAAGGPMWQWAIGCLRRRLIPMLHFAGHEDIADELRMRDVFPAIDRLEALHAQLGTEVRKS